MTAIILIIVSLSVSIVNLIILLRFLHVVNHPETIVELTYRLHRLEDEGDFDYQIKRLKEEIKYQLEIMEKSD